MIYKIGMYCKHFKGKTLLDKNIYKIIKLGVVGKDIANTEIKYTGDGNVESAVNLVIYENIFQENKIFAREYEDISGELSQEKQIEFGQKLKVQPLTEDEVAIIKSEEYIYLKEQQTKEKFQ